MVYLSWLWQWKHTVWYVWPSGVLTDVQLMLMSIELPWIELHDIYCNGKKGSTYCYRRTSSMRKADCSLYDTYTLRNSVEAWVNIFCILGRAEEPNRKDEELHRFIIRDSDTIVMWEKWLQWTGLPSDAVSSSHWYEAGCYLHSKKKKMRSSKDCKKNC